MSQDQHGDVYVAEPDEIRELLNKFVVKPIEWGEDEGTDVRNSGFADSHSTGNRQREGALREARQQNMSSFTAVRDIASPTHRLGRLEGHDVLSAVEGQDSPDFDAIFPDCGVPAGGL